MRYKTTLSVRQFGGGHADLLHVVDHGVDCTTDEPPWSRYHELLLAKKVSVIYTSMPWKPSAMVTSRSTEPDAYRLGLDGELVATASDEFLYSHGA